MAATTRKQEVLAALRDGVLAGDLHPGTCLNEVQLARAFGVSVTPVREALLELIAEGLAVREPNCQARVVELETPEVVDLLDVVGLLLCAMMRRAEGAVSQDAANDVAAKLRDCADQMDTASRDGSDAALAEAVRLLVGASRNGELNQLLGRVMQHAVRRLRLVSFAPVTHIWTAAFRSAADLVAAGRLAEASDVLDAAFIACGEAFRRDGLQKTEPNVAELVS